MARMCRRSLLAAAVVAVGCWSAVAAAAGPAARPNLLLVVAEGLCWRDTGFTDNPDVRTPNLDRLRAEGMHLRHLYAPASTDAPARTALLTGLFPVRSGAYPSNGNVNPGTASLFTHLKAAGYRVGVDGKAEAGPAASFPCEHLEADDDLAHDRAFVTADRVRPWLLVVATADPRGPGAAGPRRSYPPASLAVPPYLHDNARTRRALANYYAEVTALDARVGQLLDLLNDTGHADDTLVMFASERGSSLPYGGKWTCDENGIRSAAVVRWPGHVRAGSASDALVQTVDVTATFLAAAGVDPAAVDAGCPDAAGRRGLDGVSFLDVLLGRSYHVRDVVFAQQTALGVPGAAGPCPVRTAADARYQYVRCLTPGRPFSINGWTRSAVLDSWVADAAHDPALARRIDRLYHPPAEALYDRSADPCELTNVAGDPALAGVKARLSQQLDAWMAQQGDRGLATELDDKRHLRPGRGTDPE